RVLRRADRPRDCEEGGAERRPLLVVRHRDRQQRRVPDEQGGAGRDDSGRAKGEVGATCTSPGSTFPAAPSSKAWASRWPCRFWTRCCPPGRGRERLL